MARMLPIPMMPIDPAMDTIIVRPRLVFRLRRERERAERKFIDGFFRPARSISEAADPADDAAELPESPQPASIAAASIMLTIILMTFISIKINI